MIHGLKSMRIATARLAVRERCCSQARHASSSKAPAPPTATYATATQLKPKSGEVEIHKVPLSQELPGLPKAVYARKPDTDPFATEITTLDNGMRVATEAHFGEYCTFGVAIDAGARYEVGYPSGISHFIEKLAFNSTLNRSRDEAFSLIERHGGLIDCQSTKDTFVYASSCHVDGVDDVLGVIADAVLRANITDEEMETARSIVQFDVEDMNRRPDCEPLITDWIHAAAYKGNTLGLPKYCPEENVKKITREMIFSYMKAHFAPKRIVVSGVGVAHDKLVESAKKHFDMSTTTWAKDKTVLLPSVPVVDTSIAQYTGGEVRVERDLSEMSLGPTPYPDLAHFVIGLESSSYLDDDFVAFCVLNTLMGGGGSFSAGGPGKGMYTRLYLDVLNRYHWMYNATAYNHAYADSGVFCIHASSDPSQIGDVVNVLLKQLLNLSAPIGPEELNRAKTQLCSQLMMNLETRPVMFEDVARQVLGHGYRRTPMEYVAQIKKIGEKDIHRVVERMLCSKASVVGYGNLDKLPAYDVIDRVIAKRDIKQLAKNRFGRS